jgi:hypothetical protein
MGAAFGQEAANAIALDVFPLFKGFIASYNTPDVETFTAINVSMAYERMLFPHFSVGSAIDLYFMITSFAKADVKNILNMYFGIAVEGRYYPFAEFDKAFVGAAVGFNMLSVDGETKADKGGFMGFTASLNIGYKVMPTKNFYMEPSLSWVLSKTSDDVEITPRGLQGGLRVGFAF